MNHFMISFDLVDPFTVILTGTTGFYKQYYRETYHQEPNIQSPMNPIPEPPPRRITEEEKIIQRILGIRRD